MALTYSTLRVVLIPSKFLAITYSLIIIVILGYIGGFGLAYHKGYQAVCPAQSVVVTKVKGTVYTNYPDKDLAVPNPDFYRRIWDAQDIVTPPHGGENGGFFIMTNLIITANQTRDICPESPDIPKAKCQTDKDCEIGKSKKNGNGIMTGKCVRVHPTDPSAVKTCQIHAWCPVETRALPLKGTKALLEDTKDFTVLVKNTIEFPEFGPKYVRRNIVEKPPEKATEQYLQSCIYNPKTDPHCPTFRIGDIVERAGFKYSQVALLGGVFAINIKWHCDFDWGRTIDQCLPKYSFSRLDDDKARIAPGWNFRSALFHEENRRTLTQQYGIKVLIEVEGEGRKFDSIKFLLTIGAGLGFLALASLVCDFILDILCKLQNCWNRPWLAKYTPDMKYDQSFLRSYELAKQDPGSSSSPINMRSPADP